MGKLFGTDGIRGIVGENLTVELAFHTGQAIAAVLKEEKGRAPLITIGKDTRISSDMLESALICGICSVGGDVMPFGVLPTPAVAYLTVLKGADAGIVISASHNPYEHNGIKVFNEKGYKLPDATEAKIEEKILSGETIPVATRGEIGVLHHGLKQSKLEYIHHLTTTIDSDLSGLRVLVDCANGAASATAPELFGRFKCYADFIHREPNGTNINTNAGSTHIEGLQKFVVEKGLDVGFAYDGDADRCLCVDEKGNVITGDHILYIYGCYMKERGKLLTNTVVTTVMSNFGLYKAFDEKGIGYAKTAVGDKYVYEYMAKNGCRIGGEQSGHIIFSKYASTGDGILTSLKMMEVMLAKKLPMSKLAEPLKIYPQVLENVRVTDKEAAQDDEAVQAAVKAVAEALGDTGRILVRESGTEPVVRVMVEAPDHDTCQKYVSQVVEVIKAQGYSV